LIRAEQLVIFPEHRFRMIAALWSSKAELQKIRYSWQSRKRCKILLYFDIYSYNGREQKRYK